MMRKLYCNSIIEGLLRGVILSLIMDFSVSIYAVSFKRDICILIIGIVASFLCSYFLLNKRMANKKEIIISFLISTVLFWSVNVIAFFNNFTLRFCFFPLREVESGEGFIIVFLYGVYILVTIIFRLFLFVIMLVKNDASKQDYNTCSDI